MLGGASPRVCARFPIEERWPAKTLLVGGIVHAVAEPCGGEHIGTLFGARSLLLALFQRTGHDNAPLLAGNKWREYRVGVLIPIAKMGIVVGSPKYVALHRGTARGLVFEQCRQQFGGTREDAILCYIYLVG